MKKFKKILIFFSLITILFVCISTISATDTKNIDDDKNTIITENELSTDNSNSIAEKINKKQITKTGISKNVTKTKTSTQTTNKIRTEVEADEVAVEYKKNNYLTIQVEDRDDYPIKNTKLNLKVFTGTKNKTYSLTTNTRGIAKYNTKNLSLGNHKVIITSNNNKYLINKQTNIFVGKNASVTLNINTKKTLTNKDAIKITTISDDDEKEILVNYVGTPKYTKIIKAKFYFKDKKTGNTITKTDFSEFDDGRWELPSEDYSTYRYTATKVQIWYLNSKTQISNSTSTTTAKNTTTNTINKIKVDVEADEVAVEYKKNNYLTIKLEDKNDKAIKNTKINLKVFTGTKNKTYTLTTNANGIAKLNTKNLSLGNHKVIISSNTNKYIISKQTNIFVGKKASITLNVNATKMITNKDSIRVNTKYYNKYKKEIIANYSKVPKYTKIIKAKFYYLDKKTGNTITETDSAEYDDGRWELPSEDFTISRYTPTKVQIWYLTSK